MNENDSLSNKESPVVGNNNKPKHDAVLKKALEYPAVAQDFFESHLPDNIKSLVNLSTLKPEKESFVEANLSNKFSDLLFSVELNSNSNSSNTSSEPNAASTAYIYLLLESQSSIDQMMSFRLFKYMLCICDRHLALYPKEKKLPLVYPLVFTNSSKKYTAPQNIWHLFTNPELAKQWWNDDHQLINIHDIPDEELKSRYLSGMLSFFMKHMQERDLLKRWQEFAPMLSKIATLDIGLDYIELILTYTLTYIDKNDNIELQKLLTTNLTEEKGTQLMGSLAHHWMEQGIEQGILKGKTEGKAEGLAEGEAKAIERTVVNMLKQNLDLKLIQQVTGLSLDALLRIKARS